MGQDQGGGMGQSQVMVRPATTARSNGAITTTGKMITETIGAKIKAIGTMMKATTGAMAEAITGSAMMGT